MALKFALHKIRTKVSVAIDHFLATMPDPFFNDNHRCSCHDQGADSVVSEPVHTATFQTEFAKQRMKMFVENDAVHERRLPSR